MKNQILDISETYSYSFLFVNSRIVSSLWKIIEKSFWTLKVQKLIENVLTRNLVVEGGVEEAFLFIFPRGNDFMNNRNLERAVRWWELASDVNWAFNHMTSSAIRFYSFVA